jgi:hypothetical protein
MRRYILHTKKPKYILLTRQIHKLVFLVLPRLSSLLHILSGIHAKNLLEYLFALLEMILCQLKPEFGSSLTETEPKDLRAGFMEHGIHKRVPTDKVEGYTASGKRRIVVGDFGNGGGSILVDVEKVDYMA